ncbi:hypothetical protein, partial [Thioclava sp.]|uniref:hypothetical protein n=1 Tax=Thioclava sp. TaxID=1933450 RepID=UPI003242A927
GAWMQTPTGIAFWPMDPRPSEIKIDDIAHALSNLCRYLGHTRDFYSVAQHSVLVARALPPELRAWGLLHDASEAYLVDVPRPVKPYLTGYREAEEVMERAVADAFDLCWPMPPEVKRVDNAILADEAAQLMTTPPRDWRLQEPPLGISIDPWSPQTAKRRFLETFHEIEAS